MPSPADPRGPDPLSAAIEAAVARACAKYFADHEAKLPGLVTAAVKAATTTRIVSQAQLARMHGKSVKAMSAMLARPSGAALLSIAKVDGNGRRTWIESDVLALMAAGGGEG